MNFELTRLDSKVALVTGAGAARLLAGVGQGGG